jgi:DNA polymerase III subunit gamma/tau
MSAQVLARRYRPRRFDELVGQDHVSQALGNALRTGRLHHAYLFTGTRGVGKTTISRILAKSLNCQGADGQGGVTDQPCGVCAACRDIDAGRFVDYIELDAASNRGVEEISQLLDQAVYKPVVGRTKVYMVDEVHMLSTHAFNAMLKTLEEPPDYLKFILATTDPQKVPPTVLSRCLQFNLRPMPPALVQLHLGTVLAQEGVDAEAGALRLLSRAARGSMRDALSLTDQAIAFGAGRLVEAEVLRMLGSTPRAHVLALLDALSAADAPALVAEVQALQLSGHTGTGALDELARWLQLMALAQAAPQALDPADPDTADAVARAAQWPADELQLAYSLSLQGRAELALAPDEYAGLTMVLLRVLAFRPGHEVTMPSRSAPLRQSSSAPQARLVVPVVVTAPASAPVPVAAAQPRPSPAPAPAAVQALAPAAADEPPPWLDLPPEEDGAPSVDVAPAPALEPVAEAPAPHPTGRTPVPSAAPQILVPTPTGEAWAALVPQLGATALSRTLAMQAQCLVLDRGTDAWRVTLQVASETLRSAPAVSKLQGLLDQLAGVPVQLSVQAGVATDTPALRDSAAAVAAQAAAEAELEQSPELAALRRHFDTTRITPGSIKPV